MKTPLPPIRRLAGAAAAATLLAFAAVSCGGAGDEPPSTGALPPTGTPELRAALFDSVLARVERREAFSPVKSRTLGYDPLAEMRQLRDDVVSADTEEALFDALVRLSNARRDRHLSVALVPGGLRPGDRAGIEVWGDGDEVPAAHAPVRILPEYGADYVSDVRPGSGRYGERGAWFVGDVAEDASTAGGPAPGDRVVSVNGVPVDEWTGAAAPYVRHSSVPGLRWKLAEAMPVRSAVSPPELRSERLSLEVTRRDGSAATYDLPYLAEDELTWRGDSEPRYPGLVRALSTVTYDLLVPEDGRAFVVLVWTGFRETMVADVDTLLALAGREGLLDHAVIVDVTRSGGGSLGPYAVQRLQPKPFKTTFGTLRLSDVTVPFIEDKRADFAARNVNDGGVPETVDDGGWLMDWLENDVLAALETDAVHTAPVPFKLAHAPKDSDGVLQPAPVHFRGPFAVISGPSGGSHLDQFNAIVKDNGLGPIVGMPAGGYSNTWEWEEVLEFPGTDRPVVGFMYDIGHTLRPNGEVLEGNPALVDAWIPLTADGLDSYYARMLDEALARIGR